MQKAARISGDKEIANLVDIFLKKALQKGLILKIDLETIVLGDPIEANNFCNEEKAPDDPNNTKPKENDQVDHAK